MLALGVRAVEPNASIPMSPESSLIASLMLESELELQPGEHIYGRPDIWPHLKEMYEGYLSEPSRAGMQPGWHSTYAVVAYLAGDYLVARQTIGDS